MRIFFMIDNYWKGNVFKSVFSIKLLNLIKWIIFYLE